MKQTVRTSVIAGRWYPGQPDELRAQVSAFLGNVAAQPLAGELLGLIAPHAGYEYSGQTAAYAYRQVQGRAYDVVAIVSPAHGMAFSRFVTTSAAAYETPLGQVRLDGEQLAALEDQISLERVAYDDEHSLEIQLPFLQVALGDFGLLPVMVGRASFEAGEALGLALAQALEGKRALLVASTDLHHIPDYEQVVRRDRAVADAIATFDMARIRQALSPADCTVCGRVPVYAVLTAARALGADAVEILHRTNSGDVTGSRAPGQYTVGYMAAAVYKKERA